MLQLLLYFLSAKVESIKAITFILAQLLDIIRVFNGEHRAKVIVHCVGHVIVGGDNSSIQSFEWPNAITYNFSLSYIRLETSGIVFLNSCNASFLIAFFLFYNSFDLSLRFNVFCNSFFVDEETSFIGTMPPSNSMFDITVHPR